MKGLDDETIVALWERGRWTSPAWRARLLVAVARPELDDRDLGAWTIGQRDTLLLTLREATYGASAPCFVECPACQEGLQSTIRISDIRVNPPDDEVGPWHYEEPPWTVAFRCPTIEDLEWAAQVEPSAARRGLWSRLVVEAHRAGDRVDPKALPAAVVAQVEAQMEHHDPQAHIRFAQSCPACSHRFETTFDIATYLWHEVDVDARRLLREVDGIARVYGWSEREILQLGRNRRRTYLELCGSR